MRSLGPAAALLLLLGACTTPISSPPPGSPEFKSAYLDGCRAGYAYAGSPFHEYRGGPKLDDDGASLAYRAGWEHGFWKCQRSYERIQWVFNSVLGAP